MSAGKRQEKERHYAQDGFHETELPDGRMRGGGLMGYRNSPRIEAESPSLLRIPVVQEHERPLASDS